VDVWYKAWLVQCVMYWAGIYKLRTCIDTQIRVPRQEI